MNTLQKKFGQIYDQYVDKIYRFVFLKVNSQEIAEDLCSETFLRGWEAFKKAHNPNPAKPKIDNIQAFLYQIARNLVIDHYRQKSQFQVVSVESMPIIDPRENLEQRSMVNSDLDTVKAALVNIKPEYQEVIVWRYLEDLSVPEIAKILDKSEETVRVLLHRAMKKLKVELS